MRGLALFISLIISVKGFTQASNNDFYTRKAILNSLELISQYNYYCTSIYYSDVPKFTKLFLEPTTLIVNDILPDNNLNQRITVQDYGNKLSDYYANENISEIAPLTIYPVDFSSNSTGTVVIVAQKIIYGETRHKIEYSDTIYLRFTISFDCDNNEYLIKDISLEKQKGKYCLVYPKVKTIINSSSIPNRVLLINGQKRTTNENGYIFLKDIKPDSKIEIKMDDIEIPGIKKIEYDDIGISTDNTILDKNMMPLQFKIPIFTLRFVYQSTPFNIAPLTTMNKSIDISNRNSNSIGFRFGFTLTNRSKYSIRLFSGLHYNDFNYTLRLNEITNSYSSIDDDNAAYVRTNEVSDISEDNHIQSLSVPLVIEPSINIASRFKTYFSVGANITQILRASYSSNAIGQYSGKYQDLFNVTISENGVYDFGSYKLQSSDRLSTQKNIYSMTIEAGGEYLINSRFAIRIGISHIQGLSNIFQALNNDISTRYDNLSSITSTTNQFKFRYFTIDAGVSIKM